MEKTNVIDFIAYHINTPVPTEICNTVCAFTGKQIISGIPTKQAIKKTFTDFEYLKYESDYISAEAWKVLNPCIQGNNGLNALRSYSYIVTNSGIKIIKHAEYMHALINPPEPPFVFVITYSNKKHTAFKAVINHSRQSFIVQTDVNRVVIDSARLAEICPVIQDWYSVIPEKADTTLQPTWFNKSEILHGCDNPRRIEQYGFERYFTENKIIDGFRGTEFLKLITFCLTKGIVND